MGHPRIESMSNQTQYWAVLSKSASGGGQGSIQDGHFAAAKNTFTFGSTLDIPKSGSDNKRMFVQGPAQGYRVSAENPEGKSFVLTIEDESGPVWTGTAAADQKLALILPADGTPYLQ